MFGQKHNKSPDSNDDLFEDLGLLHDPEVVEKLKEHEDLGTETVVSLSFDAKDFAERALALANRHIKAAAGFGGVALGAAGFTAGAITFNHLRQRHRRRLPKLA